MEDLSKQSDDWLELNRAAVNAQRDTLRGAAAEITAEINRRATLASAAKKLAALTPEEIAAMDALRAAGRAEEAAVVIAGGDVPQ